MLGYTIAISGSSGAGKSTLVNELARQLKAVTLFFDAYQATTRFPHDMMSRLSDGEVMDIGEVESPNFDRDIIQLKNGKKVIDPWGRELIPSEFIVIEEPFGRLRKGMSDILDFVVFVDTPLDISLARRVLRDMQVEYSTVDSSEKVNIVEGFLTSYIQGLGNGYKLISDTVSKDVDLIVNGLEDVSTNAKIIIENMRKQKR
jgi:uridine kinase